MHLLNVMLHGGVGLFIFFLLSQFLPHRSAFWAALIFLLHPVHTETVANVDHGADLLAAFFGLLSILAFLKGGFFRVCSLVILLLATLSKESGLVFALLLPLVVWMRTRTWKSSAFGGCLVALLSLAIRFSVLGAPGPVADSLYPTDNILASSGPFDRILTAVLLLGKYISLFLFPFPLSSDYSFAAIPLWRNWSLGELGVAASLVLGLLGSTLLFLRRAPQVAIWGVWFFVAFSITSNLFIPIGTIFAERLLYVPAVGLVALFCCAAERFQLSRLLPILCLPMTALTFLGMMRWQNIESLATADFRAAPRSMIVQHVYADLLFRKGDYRGAIEHELIARSIYPSYPPSLKLLQAAYYFNSDFDSAESLSDELLQANVTEPKVLTTAAWSALRLKKYDKAEALFNKALSIDSASVLAKIGLFAIAVAEGDVEKARERDSQIPEQGKTLSLYREFAGA